MELGTEEIPARFLRKIEKELKDSLQKLLDEASLEHEAIETYCAPRQITAWCRSVDKGQQDREETLLGPPVSIAYDGDGNPSRALQGFLKKSDQLSLDNIFRTQGKKGEVVAGTIQIPGRQTADILGEAIPQILGNMHFPKNMRWGHCPTRFVRPVRNILALFDGQVISFEFAGCQAGTEAIGHRMIGQERFTVSGIDQYLSEKANNGIIVTHTDRIENIRGQIAARLEQVGGLLVEDEDLMEELAGLVETPYVVMGDFDPKFLEIPREVLITSLRDHQKSFCIQDESGKLKPHFLSIANVPGDDKGLIKTGNEWVLRARLYDAQFFWESDLRKNFDDLRAKLKNQVFLNKLGSYYAKTERIAALSAYMADQLSYSDEEKAHLNLAAVHCKSDLVSEMVFEFPELQGITGGLLMRAGNQPEAVAQAIYDHYLPNSMDDDIPQTRSGALVSLADKLDTLTGCFAAGLIPTGTKDPYALRRATQGIVRLLIEHQLPLSLDGLLAAACKNFEGVIETKDDLTDTVRAFFIDRVRYYLKRMNFSHDLIEAVLARDTDRVDQTLKRAEAIQQQQTKDSFRNLALNLKRMNNVIADEEDKLPQFDESLLSEDLEKQLYKKFQDVKPQIHEAAEARDYNRAMDLMTSLAEPVEAYFGTDGVFINVDEDHIRLNRKAQINEMRLTLGLVADISCLE